MNRCEWDIPCCNPPAPGESYCTTHCRALGIKPQKQKKVYQIPTKSEKKKAVDKELSKMYPIFLSEPGNDFCKIQLKGCLKKATVVHHERGRIGDQVFEVKDWIPSCVWCNIALENDPDAYKKGLKKSKFHE